MTHTMKMTIAAAATLLALTTDAHAAEGCAEAYAVGKDIARLDAEVKSIKALLEELLELDRQRTELLSRAVGDGEIELPALRASSTTKRDSDERKAPPPEPKKTGTVTGRVRGMSGVAYVYIENIRGRLVRKKTAEIAQQNRQFSPRWLVVQRGTTVTFPNQDNIYHNVFSNSPNAKFDLGIYRSGDDAKSYRFTQPGLIDVFCNMHAKMKTEVLVVPNHHYSRVKKDGSFSLGRLPPGRHHVRAWAPDKQLAEAWVDVPSGGSVSVDLTLVARSQARHLNKDGQPYGSYK